MKTEEKWFIGECYGSDDVYAWGTQSEADRWNRLTGESLTPYEGNMSDNDLSEQDTSFNLQDELNGLDAMDCPHCHKTIACHKSNCPVCGASLD